MSNPKSRIEGKLLIAKMSVSSLLKKKENFLRSNSFTSATHSLSPRATVSIETVVF